MSAPDDLIIRQMRRVDLAFAARCTADEGWVSEDMSTIEGFYLKDPKGCLLAEIGGQPVGICIATSYGKSGFIGELIVTPKARGRGVGARLLNHGVQILRKHGADAIYLDGVLKAVSLYERNGFRKVTRSWRFSGSTPGKLDQHVHRMSSTNLDQVLEIDRLCFGADRSFFIRRRFMLFPELSYVMECDGTISGYIFGRSGPGWLSAGPWIVRETVGNLGALLQALAIHAGETPISLGILDVNQESIHLVRSLGFNKRSDSPWRMVWGNGGGLGASPQCYAVGSAAKG